MRSKLRLETASCIALSWQVKSVEPFMIFLPVVIQKQKLNMPNGRKKSTVR